MDPLTEYISKLTPKQLKRHTFLFYLAEKVAERIMRKEWSPDQLIGFDNASEFQIFTMLVNQHLFWWGCFVTGIKRGEEFDRTAIKS